MNDIEFKNFVKSNIVSLGNDEVFSSLTLEWLIKAIEHNYAQNFTWLGRPIIQIPQDIYAIQELIWEVKPDLIIESGIARGGSLIMSASMMALIDYCEAVSENKVLDPKKSIRKVIGIDIDIRPQNYSAIKSHPLSNMIEMIEGSSISSDVIDKVKVLSSKYSRIMVFLDSNHTHNHVFAELNAYAPMVSSGSYCVVWDTGVEDLPEGFITNRPWGKGNNPRTAVIEYLLHLKNNNVIGSDGAHLKYSIDAEIEHKIKLTASSGGFLKRN